MSEIKSNLGITNFMDDYNTNSNNSSIGFSIKTENGRVDVPDLMNLDEYMASKSNNVSYSNIWFPDITDFMANNSDDLNNSNTMNTPTHIVSNSANVNSIYNTSSTQTFSNTVNHVSSNAPINPTLSNSSVGAASGVIATGSIDFSRISTNANDALNGSFINENSIHKEYWEGDLNFVRRDDGSIQIVKDGVVMGYTDELGINKIVDDVNETDSYLNRSNNSVSATGSSGTTGNSSTPSTGSASTTGNSSAPSTGSTSTTGNSSKPSTGSSATTGNSSTSISGSATGSTSTPNNNTTTTASSTSNFAYSNAGTYNTTTSTTDETVSKYGFTNVDFSNSQNIDNNQSVKSFGFANVTFDNNHNVIDVQPTDGLENIINPKDLSSDDGVKSGMLFDVPYIDNDKQ